jgi:hypothetical protein
MTVLNSIQEGDERRSIKSRMDNETNSEAEIAESTATNLSDVSTSSRGKLSWVVDPEVLRMATLNESENINESGRKTALCCGICCDVRRACIIIDCVYFLFVTSALALALIGWNPFKMFEILGTEIENGLDDDEFMDDTTYVSNNNEPSFLLGAADQILVAAKYQLSIGIAMSLIGLVGAVRYNPYLVLGMAIWLCIDAIIFCVLLNWVSTITVGLYSYPHFALFLALKEKKLTPENYHVTEKYCCLCKETERNGNGE